MAAESATPTVMRMVTATIIPEASPRACDSIISRPIPISAPTNSPTITPIGANEIAGDGEAKTQAGVGHDSSASNQEYGRSRCFACGKIGVGFRGILQRIGLMDFDFDRAGEHDIEQHLRHRLQ